MAVTQLLITSRQPFAHGQTFGPVGPYEQLSGTVYFAVDPLHAANQLITDLPLAPRDPRGQVHFSADYCVVKPVEPQRGNHRLLFDIVNRGRPLAFRNLNSAPDVAPNAPIDPGNGFLMRQGYTVAFCGWQQDAPDAPGLMRLRGPEAVTPEGPISGKIVVTIQPNVAAPVQRLANSLHRPYPAQRLDDPEAVLTEQDHEEALGRVIPRQIPQPRSLQSPPAILSELDRLGETRHVRCRYLPRVSTRSSSRPWSTVYQQAIRAGGRGRAWR